MAKKLTVEEGIALWRERERRLRAAQPRSFRGAMRSVFKESRQALDWLVYLRPAKHKRSGLLRRSEKLVWESEFEALLTNDAASEYRRERVVYAWFVALGREAKRKANGVYAWMLNPMNPRPSSAEEWKAARKRGEVGISRTLPAMPPRNWRRRAIAAAKRLIPRAAQRATQEAMRE